MNLAKQRSVVATYALLSSAALCVPCCTKPSRAHTMPGMSCRAFLLPCHVVPSRAELGHTMPLRVTPNLSVLGRAVPCAWCRGSTPSLSLCYAYRRSQLRR